MEIRDLLEKMMKFAGEPEQKPGDQVRGSETANPTKSGKDHPFKGRLVGASENILKDLSKGATPKSKEQELAEEFQAFLEAEFKDTVDKRPGRKGARPARGHNPLPRYKTVKADESYMSEKDIELQDYRSMTNQEFQTAYGISKMEWINQNKALVIQNPDIKRSLGINESHYKWVISFKDGKQAIYHQRSPYYSDASAASDIEYTLKANRGSKLELATKDDLAFNWQEFLGEGWGGMPGAPDDRRRPEPDPDDWYDQKRQEKLDIEAEKAQAKRPQTKIYSLLGRGPNMEPNYKFPGEYDSLEAAVAAREKIMADPKTPYPEHIGISTRTKYLDQTDEAVMGGGGIKNLADYTEKRDYIYQQLADPKQRDNYAYFRQALFDLNRIAKQAGIKIEESRAHKQLATWFKNRELAQKYASGEVKIPTPQERQAQLKKLEKEKSIKEYGAANPPQKTSPAQAQQVAANLNIQKTALNQLKQINPEIDPAKAAAAMTKDTATMSPQEKDELAQVAKTVSPALGTPAFGSIKTAIQKSQVK